jgi:hypothetical protein
LADFFCVFFLAIDLWFQKSGALTGQFGSSGLLSKKPHGRRRKLDD